MTQERYGMTQQRSWMAQENDLSSEEMFQKNNYSFQTIHQHLFLFINFACNLQKQPHDR